MEDLQQSLKTKESHLELTFWAIKNDLLSDLLKLKIDNFFKDPVRNTVFNCCINNEISLIDFEILNAKSKDFYEFRRSYCGRLSMEASCTLLNRNFEIVSLFSQIIESSPETEDNQNKGNTVEMTDYTGVKVTNDLRYGFKK